MKPIAKSLHTITVIAQVANAMLKNNPTIGADGAVSLALDVLQLSGKPDVYGLALRAEKLVR